MMNLYRLHNSLQREVGGGVCKDNLMTKEYRLKILKLINLKKIYSWMYISDDILLSTRPQIFTDSYIGKLIYFK